MAFSEVEEEAVCRTGGQPGQQQCGGHPVLGRAGAGDTGVVCKG